MIRLLLFSFIVTTIAHANPQDTEDQYAKHYMKWNQEIQRKSDLGYSKIGTEKDLVAPLAKEAHLHISFLRSRLEKNMFVYQILDESKILRDKYGVKKFQGGAVQDQQAIWLSALPKNQRRTKP